MHLGSIYLIVSDFERSIAFYEKLLEIPLESENNGRFVSFAFEGHRISLLNAHFDTANPEKVVRNGGWSGSQKSSAPLNLCDSSGHDAPNPPRSPSRRALCAICPTAVRVFDNSI